jgi:hypothetical protein
MQGVETAVKWSLEHDLSTPSEAIAPTANEMSIMCAGLSRHSKFKPI